MKEYKDISKKVKLVSFTKHKDKLVFIIKDKNLFQTLNINDDILYYNDTNSRILEPKTYVLAKVKYFYPKKDYYIDFDPKDVNLNTLVNHKNISVLVCEFISLSYKKPKNASVISGFHNLINDENFYSDIPVINNLENDKGKLSVHTETKFEYYINPKKWEDFTLDYTTYGDMMYNKVVEEELPK